jgi:hypothetical protein
MAEQDHANFSVQRTKEMWEVLRDEYQNLTLNGTNNHFSYADYPMIFLRRRVSLYSTCLYKINTVSSKPSTFKNIGPLSKIVLLVEGCFSYFICT